MVQLKGKVWGGLQAAAASPAGRVATVFAQRMGQGDRLRRVQHTVARKLHAQDSLNSMGSEALNSMGPFSPAAADGYSYRCAGLCWSAVACSCLCRHFRLASAGVTWVWRSVC